jgi:PAS domain S-box-containing protein
MDEKQHPTKAKPAYGPLFAIAGIGVFVVACLAGWSYVFGLGLNAKPLDGQEVARRMLAILMLVVAVFELTLYILHAYLARQDQVIRRQEMDLERYSQRLEELVTEQYAKLKRVMGQFEAVTDNVPVIFLLTDREGRIVFAEGSGLSRLGYQKRDLLNRPLADVLHGESQMAAHLDEALGGNSVGSTDRVGKAWYAARYAPVKDEEGRVKGALVAAVDVTEQQAALTRAEELETKFRRLAEAVGCGLVVIASGKITYANETAARIMETSPKKLAGGRPEELLDDTALAAIGKITGASKPTSLVMKLKASGKQVPVTLTPFNHEGREAAMIVMAQETAHPPNR